MARDYNNDLSLVHKVQAFENSPTLGRPGLSKKLVNYYLMKNGNRFTDQPNYATMEFKDEIVNRDPRLAQTIRTSNINMNVTMTVQIGRSLFELCRSKGRIRHTDAN